MIKKVENGIILNVRILPNSSKNCMVCSQDAIKVKITAPPVEGKANKALVEFLSKTFKVPKTYFEIVKGETSKDKSILIKNIDDKKFNEIETLLRLHD